MSRKFSARRIALIAASLVLALALVPVALAGKPGGGGGKGSGKGGTTGGGSLSLVMVTDNNSNGLPNWGDSVTFNVSTTATAEPHVDLTCSQAGVLVYSATAGFFDSYPWPWTRVMSLASQSWTGGAASCVARLYYFSGSGSVTLASQSFTAGA